MKLSTVEARPRPASADYVFRAAREDDAQGIVTCYESVFGPGGIRAAGHEPYPAPQVFFEEGVCEILKDPLRQFMVIEMEGEVAAGMIISHNSRFHREFGCVAVAKKYQGRGISTILLKEAKALEQQEVLAVNVTEIVTHSILSQSAHKNAGYHSITGFGFCQYPNVFFLNHPESCLWITSFEGSVVEALKKTRPKHAITEADELRSSEQALFANLSRPRSIYVPTEYFGIVSKIASQFDDVFSYRIYNDDRDNEEKALEGMNWKTDDCADYPWAYINFPARKVDDEEFLHHVRKVTGKNKRYIQARIPTGSVAAIQNIELLRQYGFVFLGWVPLFSCTGENCPTFDDVLIMQWLKPEVLASNALPGETEAVVKLHGYPLNLTGSLISTIRTDLMAAGRRSWSD